MNRITDGEIAEIKERAESVKYGVWRGYKDGILINQDIPKLLAEIERLEEILYDAYEEIRRGKDGRAIDIIEEWGDSE